MKPIFLLLFFTSILTVQGQCGRQDSLIPIDEPEVYPVEGTAVMQFEIDGTKQVIFEDNFATIQGLELRVFLSTTERLDQGGSELEITTEPLQDDNGGQDMGDPITGLKIFDLPQDIGLSDYDYVIIQCVQADVLWGRATLGALEGADCSVLNLEDNTIATTTIFPNPTNDIINISSQTQNIEVALYDTLGKKVFEQTGTQTIDLSNVLPGVYFIQFIEGEKKRTLKIIRQ